MPSNAGSSSIDKALDLLEVIVSAGRPMRLSELAQAVDMHRATAYRVLLTLIRRGWVLRDGDDYLPGLRLPQLSKADTIGVLVARARPVLEQLAGDSNLMVNLQVLHSAGSQVVDVVRPQRLEMINDLRGELLPIHRFAGPLALVALLTEPAREHYFRLAAEAGLEPAAIQELRDDVEAAARTGFVIERGRHEAVIASMSHGVRVGDGLPDCAVTVVGLVADFDDERLPAIRDRLTGAADALQAASL
ncbi:IclR family transcriptional regulator [Nakamurella lactea]|uniref:IclR family transcriptional regulator n=1 Tax=Nakamurella lactea TaxID=459515 RepID=UPI0004287DAE|nr:helix-turn-helix domain-containing protein [Nakamurella lactea]